MPWRNANTIYASIRIPAGMATQSGSVIAYSSEQLAHRDRRVGHAVGEAPLVVVPGHYAHEVAVLHLGLVHVEGGGMRVVVEVDRDVRRIGVAEDALELLFGCPLHRLVDLFLGGLARG